MTVSWHRTIGGVIVAAVPAGRPAETPGAAQLAVSMTGRLAVVEPLQAEHEEGLMAAASDTAIFAWMPTKMGESREALREWLQTALEAARRQREIPFAIRDARSGELVGSTRFLELRLEHLRVEIGWTWLRRSAWSTGINVETKLMLLERAFEHAGLRRVEFKTDARNERSRGALHALGAQFEGILRKHMVVGDGGARDSAYFSVIDDEWPRVKAALEDRVTRASKRGQ